MIENIFFRGRLIGRINYENKTYFSHREKEHFFVKFNGWGISLSLLEYLEQKGIEKVIIEFNGFLLETTTDKFWAWGIKWKDSTFGKEEEQVILPIKYFNENKVHKDLQMVL